MVLSGAQGAVWLPPGRSMAEIAFVNTMQRLPSFGGSRLSRSLVDRISHYAFVVFAAVMYVGLNSVFVAGFFAGIVAHEFCEATIQNLKDSLRAVFYNQNIVGMVLFGFAGLRAWAAVILMTGFLTGASVGAAAYRFAQLDNRASFLGW